MIKAAKALVDQAKRELYKLQIGEKKLVRTGRPELDGALNGLLPSDVIVISGLSGSGKTYYMEELRKNIMSKSLNDNSDNFLSLSYNWEMKTFSLLLRGLSQATGVSKKSLIESPLDDEELKLAKVFSDNYSDPRNFINQDPCTPLDFFNQTDKFLSENTDKEGIFVSLDHASLINGSNKQDAIRELVEYINKLKLKYSNVYFIILAQMNRDILKRCEQASNLAFPRQSDLENSSTLTQIASFVVMVHQPSKVNIDLYGKINPNYYNYLFEHLSDTDLNKTSFLTENRVFYHLVKSREAEIGDKTLFISHVNKHETSLPKSTKTLLKEIEAPSFEDQLKDAVIKPNTDFDDMLFENEDTDSPF